MFFFFILGLPEAIRQLKIVISWYQVSLQKKETLVIIHKIDLTANKGELGSSLIYVTLHGPKE